LQLDFFIDALLIGADLIDKGEGKAEAAAAAGTLLHPDASTVPVHHHAADVET
jgi:hypothetical protein